jgi:amino acid adenylation domain-containing protein
MKTQQILALCAAQNVQLSLENGKLEVLFDEFPTDELLTLLKANKPELIDFISSHSQTSLASQPIEKADRDKPLRLSYSQQRLWLLDKMGNGGIQNNISASYIVIGDFNITALQAALDNVIARHEVLRTNYIEVQGETHQKVDTKVSAQITLVDLSDRDEVSQEYEINQHMLKEFEQGFDLAVSKKLRAVAIRKSPQEHVILFTAHLIAADGWSMNLLVNEFSLYYQEYVNNSDIKFEQLPIQYVDYANWQRKYFDSSFFIEQLTYWEENLGDIPQLHSLPLDKVRPAVQDISGAKHFNTLDVALVNKLKLLASSQDVTLFMLLQTAFSLLLARWSNEDDIVIGTPVAGRVNAEIEPLMGYFANNLVLRTTFSPRLTFNRLLSQAKDKILNAFSNQDIPFELLVDKVQPERTLSYTPLFQIMFRLQNNEQTSLVLPGADVSTLPSAHTTVKFDLDLSVSEDEGKLDLTWSYATSLFEAETIMRMNESFEMLLSDIVRDSEQNIYQLNMVSAKQKQEFSLWNNTNTEFEQGIGMHELFIRRALLEPNSIAVTDINGSVTYEQLLRLSLSVAKHLKDHGVQTEDLVGVRLPKGRYQVIATLGIIMAGGAYLPMEIKWPQTRCHGIVEQAGVKMIIFADERDSLDSSDILQVNICEINPQVRELAVLSKELAVSRCSDKLAYVIFTSGSTGKPKGVAIEHGAAVNTLIAINEAYQITSADKALAVSALSFDLSVYDIFGMLAAGGEVVYPEDSRAVDPEHWAELVEHHNITLFNAVPASADLLVMVFERLGKSSLSSMRNILMSGDWISPTLPKRLWQVFNNCQTHSLGGATEASIWSISYPITEDTSHLKSVPYGKPMANQTFHILNREQQPVPVGVPGELFIGGKGVARCYFGDEERTVNSFISNSELNDTLYKTGDLGRYLPDGNIEFIGRIDDQVKILGFRVELGEIEANLVNEIVVKEAIVQAVGEGNNTRLAAYVIPETMPEDIHEFNKDLKRNIALNLPTYMLPTAFVLLQEFPLTANGKVNKKALPEPSDIYQDEFVEPETETEIGLTGLWQQILELDKVSSEANFFELGGNSLQLSKMIYEVNEMFEIELSFMELFELATLRLIASKIDEKVLNKKMSERMLSSQSNVDENTLEILI